MTNSKFENNNHVGSDYPKQYGSKSRSPYFAPAERSLIVDRWMLQAYIIEDKVPDKHSDGGRPLIIMYRFLKPNQPPSLSRVPSRVYARF